MTESGVPGPRDGEGQGGAQPGEPPDLPSTPAATSVVTSGAAETAPDSDPEPGPKMTDQDAVDAFPVGKLTKLDELISNPRYVIFLSFVKFFMFFFLKLNF